MLRFRPCFCAIGKSVLGPMALVTLCFLVAWQESGAQDNGVWIDRFGGDQGLNGAVSAIAVTDSGEVYVGGGFTEAGGKVVNHISKWTGTSWEGLGAGVNDYVEALALAPTGVLYVGGEFTAAGGRTARGVARWTGERWDSLEGLGGAVFALAVSDSSLFAGGRFTYTNEGPVHRLARRDGASWLDVGGGVEGFFQYDDDNARVYALALGKKGLYVGGHFLKAGGQPTENIALWDGAIWHTLGPEAGGTNGTVESIAVSDSGAVYVGGDFTEAGSQEANHVARWTGRVWEPLGAGVNGPVYAIALGKPGEVYVGGYFTEAGGLPANNIARWTGSSWEPLGSGVDLYGIYAVDIQEQDVYVGGAFTQAGGMSSGNIALWHEDSPTGVEMPLPEDKEVLQFDVVYPNPIVDRATVTFHLLQPMHVRLDIHNLLGQRAAVLLDSIRPAGTNRVPWRTAGLPAGIYIVRLRAGSAIQSRSVVLTR